MTIKEKVQFYTALAETEDYINRKIEDMKEQIQYLKKSIEDDREEWDEEGQSGKYEESWSYESNMNRIAENEGSMKAYNKIIETIRKM